MMLITGSGSASSVVMGKAKNIRAILLLNETIPALYRVQMYK